MRQQIFEDALTKIVNDVNDTLTIVELRVRSENPQSLAGVAAAIDAGKMLTLMSQRVLETARDALRRDTDPAGMSTTEHKNG